MSQFILSIEKLALAFIVGGGVIMAAGVRPLLLPILANSKDATVVATVEGISINAWHRYNRFTLFATIVAMVLGVVRIIADYPFAYWHMCIAMVMLLALLAKLSVDKQLRNRLQETDATAVGSADQNSGHRRVEFLSKIILILALVLFISPY